MDLEIFKKMSSGKSSSPRLS